VFNAPLWLYALATLAIPLALHLWSRRPRRVIRVGSLRHVADLAEARSWSARLTEPLLLLLRLGMLASVVLALAGPRIGAGRLGGRLSHLVLVEPDLLADSALIRSDPLLDSLARSRVTVRLLTADLPRWQLDGWRSGYGMEVPHPQSETLWNMLLSADALVSPGGSILVIARPRVATLGGRRPALHAAVSWHIPANAATETRWLAGRWTTTPDSSFEVSGVGSARGIWYRSRMLAGNGSTPCAGCSRSGPVTVLVEGEDSTARRRLHLAALAVGSLFGQTVELAAAPEHAGLVLTTAALTDSLLTSMRPLAAVSPVAVGSPALADTVLAHWPWNPLVRDRGDPREVSLSQALPGRQEGTAPEQRDVRLPLLLLAMMLFAVERWLATRPRRSAA
jgi:aerotolerance regulator-like protein